MKIQQIDYSVDLLQTLLWQYNDADKIQALIEKKQAWYDAQHTAFWQFWYASVFNLLTADHFGLAVWSIILGVPNFIPSETFGPVFGFNQLPMININLNFGNSNFAQIGGRIVLSIEEQRLFLRLRYYQLISRGARLQTNTMLDSLFNDPDGLYQGGAWVVDNFDMTITYYFNCPISTPLLNVLKFYDTLPRPAAVRITDYIVL